MINLNYIFVILFSLLSYSQVFSQSNKIRISRSVIGSYGGSHSGVNIAGQNCVIMDNVGEVAVITSSGPNGNLTLTQGFEQAKYSLEKLEIELPKIPNAFSPDANGVNDTWPWNQNVDAFYPNIARVLIFNRWGDLVIDPIENPINLDNIWDGSNKQGEAVAAGTYFYIIEYNSGLSQSGWVQLVR